MIVTDSHTSNYINSVSENSLDYTFDHSTGQQQAGMTEQALKASYQQIKQNLESSASAPEWVGDMLQKTWHQYMANVYMNEGNNSDGWKSAVLTVEQLLDSVQPVTDKQQRKTLLKSIPSLLQQLRHGFSLTAFGVAEKRTFFTELEQWHLHCMKPQPAAVIDELEVDAESTECQKRENSSANFIQEQLQAEAVDQCQETLLSLAVGNWFYVDGDDGSYRCKLAAIDQHPEQYTFVNRSGNKVAELKGKQLALYLYQGVYTLLDDTALFSNALASVIGHQRDKS